MRITPATIRRYYPLWVAALLSILALVMTQRFDLTVISNTLSVSTLTFGVVVSGFTATQRNMLLSLKGSEVLSFAAKTGHDQDILDYLNDAIYAGLGTSLVSVVGFCIQRNELLCDIWTASLAFFIVLVILLLHRNERLMRLIMDRFMREQTTPSRRPRATN